MSGTNYSIDEILKAVNEINKDSKTSFKKPNKNNKITTKSDIPVNTLKIIEEAEKSKNQ